MPERTGSFIEQTLQADQAETGTMRIAAVSDLHYGRESKDKHKDLFESASDDADILLLCGDLTDYGTPEEASVLADDLRNHVHIPILAVFGNHDFEGGKSKQVRHIMEEVGVRMLDGESVEIDGVGFAGTCGFAGGFDKWALNPWGEAAIKEFVNASVDEALKLETALARLECDVRIVMLHYAPIRETVVGESPEIFPFLGSSRLEDPLNHYGVNVVFHGHAHHGAPEGRTSSDIPVYNVSIEVLRGMDGAGPLYKLYETSRAAEEQAQD